MWDRVGLQIWSRKESNNENNEITKNLVYDDKFGMQYTSCYYVSKTIFKCPDPAKCLH